MVKNIRSKPWFELYKSYVDNYDLKDKAEKKWAYVFARNQYKFYNPKESNNWYVYWLQDAIEEYRKPVLDAVNWFTATAFVGAFSDEFASKFEMITGVPKKHAQDWNTLWSSLDHVALIWGGAKLAFSSDGLADVVSEMGENSLYFTVPFALFNLAWNSYRLLNRDDKARPAFGYLGVASNGFLHLRKNRNRILNDLKYFANTNHPDLFNDYSDFNSYLINDSDSLENMLDLDVVEK